MKECIKLACQKGEGDLAYLLDDRCFLVKCYTTCDVVKAPHANSAAARLEWTGGSGHYLQSRFPRIEQLINT